MYNFVKGNRLFLKGSRENDDPDAVNGEVELINDQAVEREQHDFASKNHMASASQESREVFRTAHNRNGLKTVHTQRVVKKTTSVNRGEQKKLPTYSMIEGNKLKERLMKWARKSTRGYPHVNVVDFGPSWRDGLALNAIIHRNRPDLVDYHKCQESSARDNLANAFHILEKHFGITPTLDPDTMARLEHSEDEVVKYLAAVYEVFPDPPDHNPLWDAEKIRRIDEYKELASRLLVWLREVIPKLKDRSFPNTIPEMLQLREENRLFRTEAIPPKLHDKQRLASSYEDVLNMARGLPGKHVKIEEEYNIAHIEALWSKMITAHQERDHALNEELARLEKLERLAEGLVKEIDICDSNLDQLKKRISVEEGRVLKQDPLEHNHEIDNIARDLAMEEERIKGMYGTLKVLADGRYHRVGQLTNQVDYLAKKHRSLKGVFEKNVVEVLADRRAAALRRPKTEEELIRENALFKFLHDCIQWCLEKRAYLESLSLGEDVHSITRRLEQFVEEQTAIGQFESKVERCHAAKRDIKPEEMPIYANMLSRLNVAYEEVKGFAGKRVDQLKSLLEFVKAAERELAWIGSKEEVELARDWSLKNLNLEELAKYHYSLVRDMEGREREFNGVQAKGEALLRDRHPSTKYVESLMARMQGSWSWLLQLINCLEEHLRHTGEYYHFMEEVAETKKAMNSVEDKLNNQYSRQHFLIEEGEKMLKEMGELKEDIARIGDKVVELDGRAGTIVNMKQRKTPLPRPIKIRSLCMINNKAEKGGQGVTINKGETVTLLDNSQRLKWKVQTSNGTELTLPSVCFIIPPPDPDVLDAMAELKAKQEALIALWAAKHRELRQNMILQTLKIVKDWDYPTYCAMDPKKRDGIMRMLEEDIDKLAREGPPDDPKIRRLQDELEAIKRKFADFEARKRKEEEDRLNAEKVARFIEAVNDILEKLQEKERILMQRASNAIPRDRPTLESLIHEHAEFEHDLARFESKIKSLKEEFTASIAKIKSHAAQSKYEATIETWDRVTTLSKHYSERLKALEVVLGDIEAATGTLQALQSKLTAAEEVPADELDLKRMLAELVEANSSISSNSAAFEQLLSNVTKVRRLVERTRPKQATHSDLSRLEEDVKTVYKKWKAASVQITERLSGLELCRDLLRKYRSLMDSEKGWLSATGAKVKTMLNRADLESVTKIYESIVQRKPSIEDTNIAGGRFISEAKSLNVKIKAYRESVAEEGATGRGHEPLSAKRARKYTGVEAVEQELEALNREYKALLDQVLSYLNQLQDDETRMREFNSIADKLKDWLGQKEKLISVLGPIASEPYIVNTQLKQINVMKDEFSSQEGNLAKMDKLGNSILERVDRSSPAFKGVQHKMADIHKSWKELLAVLDEREKNLQAVSAAAADFAAKLAKLNSNLETLSNEFEHITNSGLDADEQLLKITNLEESLEGQRPLLAECGNAANFLCTLLTDAASKTEIKEKFKAVEARYNDLCRRVANRKGELQSSLKEDREFFMSCDELQEWLRNMLNLLSKDIRISAVLEVVTRQIHDFEPIYRQVMDKEHEVHMVLNRGANILNKAGSSRGDAANWRHTLENIKRQWELVKKEAIEKNTKLHKCLDVCRKYNAALNELVPLLKGYEAKLAASRDISLHRADLERQFRDIQFLKNDISKHQQDFDALRNLADSLLSIADTDKETVRDQMAELKELWERVGNEVLKRHQHLESILAKFNQYKEALRDFVHQLQRLEDRAASHESFADAKLLERMRALLEEARGLRHQLDSIKNLAAELISEVANDQASAGVRQEVKDVEERYNALLARLEEKYRGLDSLSSALKSFNLQLSELQAELNRLEQQLNSMEPIGRSLSVLKSQLEAMKDFRTALDKVGKRLKEADGLYRQLKEQDYNIDSSVNRFALDNLHRQYARLDEAATARLNGIQAMIDKLKAFGGDLAEVDRNIGDVTRDFDRFKPISRDVDTIRAQQSEFKAFLGGQVDPLARKVDDLKRKANGLVQSAAPGVDTTKLEADVDGVLGKWNDLKDKINERGRKLDVAMMQAGRFRDALEAFEKWLKETEEAVANQRPPSADYKELKGQIQEQQYLRKTIADREGSLQSLGDMAKDFSKNLDSNEKYQIEAQLADLGRRFNALKAAADARLRTLETILPVAKAFLDKVVPLSEWLDVSERKLKQLKQSVAVDADSLKGKLAEQRHLHADIVGHKADFDALTDIAQQLMALVADDQAQRVVDKYKELTDRYAKLVEESAQFGDALAESNEILKNFMLNFEDLFRWIDRMDARVSRHRVAAVTVEKIKEQVEEMTECSAEISATERKVAEVVSLGAAFLRSQQTGQVTSSSADSLFIKQKSDQLQYRFGELQRKAADILAALREVLPIAGNFYAAHDKLNAWFDVAERSLKNLESGSLKAQEATIHALEKAIPENKALLDVVNALGPQFCQYTPGQGTATIEGIVIKDNRRFNAIVEQINRQVEKIDAWKAKSDELVNDIDELYEWFKDAERQLLEAEGISHEPAKLVVALKETKALYDDINSQKGRVRDALANVKKLISRNAHNEDMIYIREKSEELKDLANHVSQLCLDRLNLLEQALPLAEHFHEAYTELAHWLDEAEQEAQMLSTSVVNAHQIRRLQDALNALNRAIAEHKPSVERLNKTGTSLAAIVQERDSRTVKRMVDSINERYNALKVKMRSTQDTLDSALAETSQFADKMDGLLKALAATLEQLKNAEPVAALPERLQAQIGENNAILEDLERRRPAYESISSIARELISKAGRDEPSVREISGKLAKLNDTWTQCNQLAGSRKGALADALRLATRFWEQLAEVMRSLKGLERALSSDQETAAVEPNAIARQQEQLREIKREMDATRAKMDDVKATGKDLLKVAGAEQDRHEVKKGLEEMDALWATVSGLYSKREKELKAAMERAMKFHEALQALLEFLDKAEDTFVAFGPVAADLGAVKSQLTELAAFKRHVDGHIKDVENFNRLAADLLEVVPSSQVKSIREPLNEVNHRWDDLQKAISGRQAELESALLKLGQFEQSLNDFLEWIRKTEAIVDAIQPTFSDPQVLEVELAKFKVLANDIHAHQSTVDSLNGAGRMLIEAERGSENARSTQTKLNGLNSRWTALLEKTDGKRRDLEELLKEATGFNQELVDTIAWIGEMENEMGVSKPVGGLPETCKEQLARFMEVYKEIDANRFKVEQLLERGAEYQRRTPKDRAPNMAATLKTLKAKWESLLAKANEKKIKLEIALAEAVEFHNALEAFIQWLTEAEKHLANLAPVSRVLERITEQIEEHKGFQKDVSDHREVMLDLDKKGTHLKYFSQKQDVILIKNLLVNVQHRWEKVLSKAAERSRALDYGLRETKEFYDAWSELMAWLTELEKNFDSTQQLSNNSEVIRAMIAKHREFQRQLGSRHAQYDATLKMGKHLKEKAPKVDVPVLQNMIDELKNLWNTICNKSVDRQRRLEEALLFSGQFKDAIDALMDWLEKAKEALVSGAAVYGDLDTVTALVEQHKIFQEEFRRREKTLQSVYRISEELLKTAEADDAANIRAEISALNDLWKEVEALSGQRSGELEKAVVEAERLHKSVHMLLEWLSDAEMKLRFSGPLPEEESTTREQIAEHEHFMKEMAVQEKAKEGTVGIAQAILEKCHPEATPVIKHWITIITSRWEEVNSWATQREVRLTEHLKSLLDIMDSLEKLLAWLIGAEAALLAAETQPLPDDNYELEKLIEEHQRFGEELEKRGVDVEKIVKNFAIKKAALSTLKSKEESRSYTLRGGRGAPRSSTPKIPSDYGFDVKHPKVRELQEKYAKVGRLAADRMKRLQEKLRYNNEVERVKHFDFDDWRRRFLGWMNNKKARVIDFFKRIDTNNDGRVTKAEFVEGFVGSGASSVARSFTTSRLEMEKVAEVFDRNGDGYIDHKEYLDTLRPERDLPKTESEIIQDEVQKQVDECTCTSKYMVCQVGECKYRFGESQKLRLVRILRSTVMVRVGGGWVSLNEFLHKHDPCRLKGRTNIELREQLTDSEGKKSLYNENGTISAVGPITKIKEKTERSYPMNAHDQMRFNATTDYSGFSDHGGADSSGFKSRPRSRLTISSNSRPGSRHSSQPPSRAASDLSVESLDSYNQKYKFVTKSGSTHKLPSSRQGSMSNLRLK